MRENCMITTNLKVMSNSPSRVKRFEGACALISDTMQKAIWRAIERSLESLSGARRVVAFVQSRYVPRDVL